MTMYPIVRFEDVVGRPPTSHPKGVRSMGSDRGAGGDGREGGAQTGITSVAKATLQRDENGRHEDGRHSGGERAGDEGNP
jgi:hypothetical protein